MESKVKKDDVKTDEEKNVAKKNNKKEEEIVPLCINGLISGGYVRPKQD